MDTFMCSSWYHFRYPSPRCDEGPFDRAAVDYWLPVDMYFGGAEHAVMHLLYARFFCKMMYDAGYVDFAEPYAVLRNQGMIQAEDGQKMSKSKGNVVTPDSVVERYGADSLRLYELFIAPFEQSVAWSDRGVQGCSRFLARYWGLVFDLLEWEAGVSDAAGSSDDGNQGSQDAQAHGREAKRLLHKTIRKVTSDMEGFRFNTAVAALMGLQNELLALWNDARDVWSPAQWRETVTTFTALLAPAAQHVPDEVWELVGRDG